LALGRDSPRVKTAGLTLPLFSSWLFSFFAAASAPQEHFSHDPSPSEPPLLSHFFFSSSHCRESPTPSSRDCRIELLFSPALREICARPFFHSLIQGFPSPRPRLAGLSLAPSRRLEADLFELTRTAEFFPLSCFIPLRRVQQAYGLEMGAITLLSLPHEQE